MTRGRKPPADGDSATPPAEGGRRKDGKPYKDGNTRDDGSYGIGKYRPDPRGQFKPGPDSRRGKRQKGSKNVATIFRKQLAQKRTIDGTTKTQLEWVIEALIRRGITRSDRAGEKVIEHAERYERASEQRLRLSDEALLEAWLGQQLGDAGNTVSDDLDGATDENGGIDDDQ